MSQIMTGMLDGVGANDPAIEAASIVIDRAINDEIDYRGKCVLSETFACFLEFRIAELLREGLEVKWTN